MTDRGGNRRRRSRRATTAGSLSLVLVSTIVASWASGAAASMRVPTAGAVPTAYVTNSLLNTLSVIQGTQLVKTISHVGKGPVGVAVTPDHTTAYVADFGFINKPSHTVTPVDLSTGQPGLPIQVGTNPMEIAITPDGTTAVVTLQGNGGRPGHQVVTIDLATRAVSAPVEVGLNPESVAISPDGATAYVGAFSAAKITPVDLTTSPPHAEAPIPLPGTSPRAIAVSPAGATAYVLDAQNASIIPIDLTTRTVGTPVDLVCHAQGDPGCTPTAIAIDAAGTSAYVAAAGSSDLMVLALPSLTVSRVLATGGYPDAVGLAPGWIYVANGASDTVSVFRGSRRPVSVPGMHYPIGIAVVPG
jgi:YVTN family beta-propeller protein